MRLRPLIPASVVVLAAAACSKAPPPRRNPPVPVTIATAVSGTVPITYVTNGTVEPIQTVAIQPQATGAITAVRFNEGDEVREGQVLFVIDPRPYQAALAQAQATLARDQATAVASRADAARYGSLVSQGYVTQSQAQTIQAQANAIGATIAADQAQVEAARVNLSYTVIKAPISGKTGNLNVRLGNQVRVPNTVPLVTINAVAPVLVRFPVPDRVLPQVRGARQAGRQLEVTIAGPVVNGAVERGTVDFIDNAVDTTTGSVTLKARFANTDRRLWPGAFLPLTLGLGQTPQGVLVPSTAVQDGPQGPYVFMPDSAGKARQVPVVAGQTAGGVTLVTRGVA
ncbi:MAG TPA: efflux RND transporter periplasmic adaptor subunit, partial [Gemmatirosa sp.]